jgi:hypothetical protein
MKKAVVILLISFCFQAQSEQPYIGLPQSNFDSKYVVQSDLLVIRFVPSGKRGKIFLAGTKAVDLDLNKDAKLISVTLFKDHSKEVLKLTRDGTYYDVKSNKSFSEDYELHVKAEVHGKTENLKLKVSKP